MPDFPTMPTEPASPSGYPTELVPTANGVTSYVLPTRPSEASEEDWTALGESLAAAQVRPSPVDRIVAAFDALRPHVADLDADGLAVLASCAEQIVINGFHGKGSEALAVCYAAKALMA